MSYPCFREKLKTVTFITRFPSFFPFQCSSKDTSPIFSLFLLTLNLKASFSKSAYAYAFAALVTNLDIEVKLRTCMKE